MTNQNDFIIDNGTGLAVRQDIQDALQALAGLSSGDSAPSTTYAFQLYANTSTDMLQIRNAANSAFIDLFQLDGTFTLEDGSASTPALSFRDDLNTGIFSSAADTFNVATGGVERMELGATTIFNEDGADVDFRIESDINTHAFFLQASDSRIGINVSSPTSPLHIAGGSDNTILQIQSTDAGAFMTAIDNTGSGSFGHNGTDTVITCDAANSVSNSAITFNIDSGSEKMRITNGGLVGIGVTNPSTIFHVKTLNPDIHLENTGSGTGQLRLGHFGNGAFIGTYSDDGGGSDILRLGTHSGDERMRITSDGNVFVGKTSSSMGTIGCELHANGLGIFARSGLAPLILNRGTNDGTIISLNRSGTEVGTVAVTSSNASFNTSVSDRSLKKNFEDWTENTLNLFKNIKPQKFNFISEENTEPKTKGYIAQDLVDSFPEAYPKGDNGKYMFNPSGMVVYLMKAIQELEAKVAALEAS